MTALAPGDDPVCPGTHTAAKSRVLASVLRTRSEMRVAERVAGPGMMLIALITVIAALA